jgi:hypothetical protein
MRKQDALAVATPALFLLLVWGVYWTVWGPSDDSHMVFFQVEKGMSRQQVESLLGGPAHHVGLRWWDERNQQWETWGRGRWNVDVVFDNEGLVKTTQVSETFEGHDRRFFNTIRGWLGLE